METESILAILVVNSALLAFYGVYKWFTHDFERALAFSEPGEGHFGRAFNTGEMGISYVDEHATPNSISEPMDGRNRSAKPINKMDITSISSLGGYKAPQFGSGQSNIYSRRNSVESFGRSNSVLGLGEFESGRKIAHKISYGQDGKMNSTLIV